MTDKNKTHQSQAVFWRTANCLSAVEVAAATDSGSGVRLDENVYAIGNEFLEAFEQRKKPGSSLIYAPGHSQLICFHDAQSKSASFWVGPWQFDENKYIIVNPQFVGDLVDEVENIDTIYRLLDPGKLFTIVDPNGVRKDVQAFPLPDMRVDSSKWTGTKDTRYVRQQHSIERYIQIKYRRIGRYRIPVVCINQKYSRHFNAIQSTLSFLSIFVSSFIAPVLYSILSGVLVFIIIELLKRLHFFELVEIIYPSPDVSQFASLSKALTSSSLDYNRWKDDRTLGPEFPDNLCILNFTNERELLGFYNWLKHLTGDNLNDENKKVRMTIVVEENLRKYYVCVMPVRIGWRSKRAVTAERTSDERVAQIYEIAHDWTDMFEVPQENVASVERFLKCYRGDNRCTLVLGVHGGRYLADAFVIHDFHLISRPALDRNSHEYSLLKHHLS